MVRLLHPFSLLLHAVLLQRLRVPICNVQAGANIQSMDTGQPVLKSYKQNLMRLEATSFVQKMTEIPFHHGVAMDMHALLCHMKRSIMLPCLRHSTHVVCTCSIVRVRAPSNNCIQHGGSTTCARLLLIVGCLHSCLLRRRSDEHCHCPSVIGCNGSKCACMSVIGTVRPVSLQVCCMVDPR